MKFFQVTLISLCFTSTLLAVPEFEQEKEKRLEMQSKALDGDLNAMYQLGTYYLLRRDNGLAEKWFKKASLEKHTPSLWKWVEVLKRKKIEQAEDELLLALESLTSLKEMKAHYELGELYRQPDSKYFNYSLARMHYEFSALAGDSEAMLSLGHLFLGENDHSQNFVLAYQWFERAAELKVSEGNRFLGMCYRYGLGVAKDLDQAWRHYGLAAKQGDLESAYTLAEALYEGSDVAQDKNLARRYYQQAAKYGFKDAQTKLKNLSF